MKAIVLSRQDFRESDQLVSLYSKHYGKREALARGVKKITSKNAAHLEPFSLVRVEIVKGKKIDHLTKVQPLHYYKNIRSDYSKSICALYVVNILSRLTKPNEIGIELYNLTKSILDYMEEGTSSDTIVLAYLSRLMILLGHTPQIDNCVECGMVVLGGGYWSVELGGIVCDNCNESDNVVANVEELTWLWQRDWTDIPLEISDSTRDFICNFLQYHSEQEVPRLTKGFNYGII